MAVKNALSVDVEDYFHAEALSRIVPREQWNSMESRVVGNTTKVLELFERHGVRATFFVLGWVGAQFPELVKTIHAAGHEIGCHSYWHRLIYRLSPEEFREDTRQAKETLEDCIGEAVIGYRAPTFSITHRSLWAFDILAEEGFVYDSSVYPIRHDFYGIPDYPRFLHRQETKSGQTLIEVPMATWRMMGMNFPFGGGGYLRIFPALYTWFGFQRVNQGERKPVVVYFHPWELDPGQPRFPLSVLSRLRHYTNLRKVEGRIDSMLRRYEFSPIRNFLPSKGEV